MKKIAYGIFALLLAACNTTTNKPTTEKTTVNTTTQPKEKPTNANTKFGIASTTPTGLAMGQKVPNVTLTFENGTTAALSTLYKKQPLVIFFYRGYWCPYCSKYLSEMAIQAKDLENAGAKLIAISPETYDNVDKAKAASHADFDVVSDTDGAIMKAFKVNFDVTDEYQAKLDKGLGVDLATSNAAGEAVLPIPATYVVDTNGTIVYAFNNPDYTQRAPITDILLHLPQVKK